MIEYLDTQGSLRSENFAEYYLYIKESFVCFFRSIFYKQKIKWIIELGKILWLSVLKCISWESFVFNVNFKSLKFLIKVQTQNKKFSLYKNQVDKRSNSPSKLSPSTSPVPFLSLFVYKKHLFIPNILFLLKDTERALEHSRQSESTWH